MEYISLKELFRSNPLFISWQTSAFNKVLIKDWGPWIMQGLIGLFDVKSAIFFSRHYTTSGPIIIITASIDVLVDPTASSTEKRTEKSF